MIFIQVVRPLLLEMAGCKEMFGEKIVEAKTATKIFSQRGRRELLTVHVVRDESGQFLCYPLTSGSGAITTLAQADGYVDIPESQEIVAEGELIKVRLFGEAPKLSDLVLIGSHCIGVDILLDCVSRLDPSCSFKVINVGSTGGFRAIQRGEADIAGVHLLDENTGEYNWPFIEKYGLEGKANLIRGYKRVQGLMIPKGNPLGIKSLDSLLSGKISFINRNPGSGTRLLIDMLVRKAASKMGLGFRGATETIQGYDTEAKSHSAVALAVKYGRADVGLGIKAAAISAGLDFLPIGEERYDFLVPSKRLKKESVKSFIEALKSDEFKIELSKHAPGLIADAETGVVM